MDDAALRTVVSNDTGEAVTVLSVFRFSGLFHKIWAFTQMGLAHIALGRLPGLRFYKLLGTGKGEGFDPKPNWSTYAILTVFENRAAADHGLAQKPFTAWTDRAVERQAFKLAPVQVWGDSWSGDNPFGDPKKPKNLPQPLAVLTRATIRLNKLSAFWGNVPHINPEIRAAGSALHYKIGLGEVPFLHQVTFSIWSSEEEMRRFAYKDTAHGEAIKAAKKHDFFKDQLFVRFKLLD